MGKASRLKAERWTSAALATFPGAHMRHMPPRRIFRFFKEPAHADALACGRVWISTLECCRRYEDPKQGDPEEATHRYHIPYARQGDMDESAFQVMARRAHVKVDQGLRATIANARSTDTITDAYVLCFTESFSPALLGPTFGRHCVCIDDSVAFFDQVSAVLHPLVLWTGAQIGRITYRERYFVGAEPETAPKGFVKPPDHYAPQREVRMLWHVTDPVGLKPFGVEVPDAARFCRRLA